MEPANTFVTAMFLRAQARLLKRPPMDVFEIYEQALPWGCDVLEVKKLIVCTSPYRLCRAAGFDGVADLARRSYHHPGTLWGFLKRKPHLFDLILLGSYHLHHATTIST